jgi:hypothetical protein
VPIYFKSGYHFGADAAAAGAGYTVIGLKEWVDFLNALSVRNDILSDYREYATAQLREREAALALVRTPEGFTQFEHAFVQYEFNGMLAEKCSKSIGGAVINRGTNVGGSSWTHLRFVALPGALPGGQGEYLFHRIDKRKNDQGDQAFYLSTRQYAVVKEQPEARQQKLERLREYRGLFDSIVRELNEGLCFSKPAADFAGANESEIGILFFDAEANTTMNVLDRFPTLHARFVERVAELRGVTCG